MDRTELAEAAEFAGGAVRGQAGARRAGPHGRADARRAAGPRALPARGRAGRRQDAGGARPWPTSPAAAFTRLQFTPDLMPADIVGTRVWRPSTETFDTELGPVFANLVLADEINRAPAKVQSALLEAMAERQVSIGGSTYPLPDPFLVLATQNPIESEGVYALPEAQRDRFLMKVDVGTHPTHRGADHPAADERRPAARTRGAQRRARCSSLQQAADRVFVHHAVAQYAVRAGDGHPRPGRATGLHGDRAARASSASAPRATLGLVAAARALALLRGRGTTCCPTTCRRGQRRRSPTGSCSPSTPSPTGSTRGRLVRPLVATVPPAADRPGTRTTGHAGRGVSRRRRVSGPGLADVPSRRLRARWSSPCTAGSTACCTATTAACARARAASPRRSPATGPGEDDVRRIDWNVTARTGEPHVWRTRGRARELDDLGARRRDRQHGLRHRRVWRRATSPPGRRRRRRAAHRPAPATGWAPACSPAPAGTQPARPGAGRHAALPSARSARDRRRTPPGPGAAVDLAAGLAEACPPSARAPPARAAGGRLRLRRARRRRERPFAWERPAAPARRPPRRHRRSRSSTRASWRCRTSDRVVLRRPRDRPTAARCGPATARLRDRYAEPPPPAPRRRRRRAVRARGAAHLVLRTDRDWIADLARFVARPRVAAPDPPEVPR